jgi:hypothetical protein
MRHKRPLGSRDYLRFIIHVFATIGAADALYIVALGFWVEALSSGTRWKRELGCRV